MQKKTAASQRKNIRFAPDEGTVASVTFAKNAKAAALVVSESSGGCALVIANAPKLALGDLVSIQLGNLAERPAEARWVLHLDERIIKAGFQYLAD